MSSKIEYIGKDLEAMEFAVNYHRWILEVITPFLGEHLVEVGAGTGAFSALLLEKKPATLSLIEPSAMVEILRDRINKTESHPTDIQIFPNIFTDVAGKLRAEQKPDSIIYVNVLEHIEDDAAELKTVYETLRPNGRVFIFVPALPLLFSRFDKHIGHFRRYRKTELVKKCEDAGFRLQSVRYFDIAGILPWLIKYRLLNSLKMGRGTIQSYDKLVVPVVEPFEKRFPPFVGKNLLLIADKNM